VQRKPDPAGTTPQETPDIITGADAGAEVDAAVAPTAAAPPDRTLLTGFATDKAALTPRHQLLIEAVAFQVWSNLEREAGATVSIAITGHTDTTGTEKHNSGLGATRAANAKAALEAALTRQAVDAAKIASVTASSRGESELLVPTADEVAEPQNRRVEIEVTLRLREKPQPPPRTIGPLPGTPGGPKIWEVPGLMDDLDQPDVYGPRLPPAPPTREWLEEALKRDPLLRELPKWAREKAIGALKDADEKAADAIIDAIPFGDSQARQAAKAAMKALLQTLKGRRFKPPPPPPPGMPDDFLKPPSFPKAPGEKIFKLPPIRF
jgi:outer membrane protein OmpA-like peptidoglycan-associated protein